MSATDPFEEFEFKPLTEGLGFHKKAGSPQASNNTQTNTQTVRSSLTRELPTLDPVRTAENSIFTKTLPKKEDRFSVQAEVDSHSQAVDQILKNLQKTKSLDFNESSKVSLKSQSLRENQKSEWTKSGPSLMAGTLDAMLILAASLLCMIILLVVTQADLIANITNPDTDGTIYLSTLSLFAMVTFIYQSAHRLYIGYTPGEWAFEQRVAHPQTFGSNEFALKALRRSFVIVLTGFFVLPLLGVIFRKDLVGLISKTPLYTLR